MGNAYRCSGAACAFVAALCLDARPGGRRAQPQPCLHLCVHRPHRLSLLLAGEAQVGVKPKVVDVAWQHGGWRVRRGV